MLLTEARRSNRSRGSRSTHNTNRRTRIIAPSGVSEGKPSFLEDVPFGAFGRFGTEVLQPKPQCSAEITRWLALQDEDDPAAAQQNCTAANPQWFSRWQTMRLFEHSLRLPAAEIAVHCVTDPISVSGNPPSFVMKRWMQAILQYPSATGYYVEPYFDQPLDAEAQPLSADALQSMVAEQWAELSERALRWRWLFRSERWVQQRIDELVAWHAARVAAKQQRRLAAERLREEQLERMRRFRETPGAPAVDREFFSPLLEERLLLQRETGRNRRLLNTAILLGSVQLRGRVSRWDPLLLISRPEDGGLLRLVAHWDDWEVVEDGRKVKKTFVHV